MDKKEATFINRIKAELELSAQKEVFNGTENNHPTLSTLLNITGEVEAQDIRALYSETEIAGKRSFQKEKALGDYDLIAPFLGGDCDHVTLHARIWEYDSFITCYIHISCPWYEMDDENGWFGLRLQLLWVNNEHQVYHSKKVIIYDKKDEKVWLDRINKCIETAVAKKDKGETLTTAEVTALQEDEFPMNEIGNELEEERYTDLIQGLKTHYENLRNIIYKSIGNEKADYAYELICQKMSECYANKGLFKQASIYAYKINNLYDYSNTILPIMSATNDPLFRTENARILSNINAFEKNTTDEEQSTFLSKWKQFVEQTKQNGETETFCFRPATRLGVMFETIFSITPQEISCMKVVNVDGEIIENVDSSYGIWDYDFLKAMKGQQHLSAYVNYRSEYDNIYAETLAEDERDHIGKVYNGGDDKSTQCTQNSIIISFDRQKVENKEIIKVSMMLPSFSHAAYTADYYGPSIIGLAFSEKEGVSEELFNQERNKAYEKIYYKKELSYDEYLLSSELTKGKHHFLSMRRAYEAKIWGDVLYYGTLAYESMSKEYASTAQDKIKDPDHMCIKEVCFDLGFAYNEYKQYQMAMYYLKTEKALCDKNLTIEYINSLSNSYDANTESFLIREYQDLNAKCEKYASWSEEDKYKYNQFLHRRIAYLYSEQKRWNEAKEILQDLLNDPECEAFAKDELKYIEEQERKEQQEGKQ